VTEAGVKLYVPCDSAALSVGADAVARAIAGEVSSRRLSNISVVRNGSRGMFWLEPLVEVGRSGNTTRPRGIRARDSGRGQGVA